MFVYLAKRKLKKLGYVYLEKYRIWYQPEFRFYVTEKWITSFPMLIKEYCIPYYEPKHIVTWKARLDDTEFTPQLATEIKKYYDATVLKTQHPILSVVVPTIRLSNIKYKGKKHD